MYTRVCISLHKSQGSDGWNGPKFQDLKVRSQVQQQAIGSRG